MANNKVVVKFLADTSAMRKSLNGIDGSLKKFGKSALALGGVLATAFAVDKVADFAKGALDAASAFEETGSKIENIFGAGGSADLQEWASTSAEAFGLSAQNALDAASVFGVYADKANLAGDAQKDFAVSLTEISSDLASFYDAADQTEVLNALQQGLRGETESLRKYGIFLDDAAYKRGYFAATGEEVVGTLTAEQKIIGANQQIFEQANVALGDYARTSDGLANTSRTLGAVLEDLKREFGEGLLPVFTELANAVLPVLQDLSPVVSQLGKDIGEALGPVLQNLAKALGPIAQTFGAIAKVISGVLTSALNAIVPVLNPLAEIFQNFASRIGPLVQRVVEQLGRVFTRLFQALAPVLDVVLVLAAELLEALEPAFDVVVDVVIILIDALIPIIKAFADIYKALAPLISATLPLFVKMLELVVIALEPVILALSVALVKAIGFFAKALGQGIGAASKFGKAIVSALGRPLEQALENLATFLDGLSGIPLVGDDFSSAASSIRGFSSSIVADLNSVADVASGVSTELIEVGEGLMEGIAETDTTGVWDSLLSIPNEAVGKGIEDAEETGERVGSAVGKGADKTKEKNKKAFSDNIKASLDAASALFESWRDKVVGWLDLGSAFDEANNAKARLSSLNDELAELRLTPEYDKAKEAELLAEIDKAGADAGKTWSQRFAESITSGADFAKQLGQLKNSGLNDLLLQQVAGMGPEAGSQLATELIGNEGLIGELNSQTAVLEQAGIDLGLEMVKGAGPSGKKWGTTFLYDENKGLIATIESNSKKVKKKIKKSLDTTIDVRVRYNADYSNAGPAYNGSGGFSSVGAVRQIQDYERLNGRSWRS